MEAIWNITYACPWECGFCITNSGKNQNYSGELSTEEKLHVVYDLIKEGFKIDFSGGDPLYLPEHRKLIEEVGKNLGKERIALSATGFNFDKEKVKLIDELVGEVEFSLDSLFGDCTRPEGYHKSTIEAVKKCKEINTDVSISTVLKRNNTNPKNLQNIYNFISKSKVKNWYLIPFYKAGRGMIESELEPTQDQYERTVDYLLDLRKRESNPRICFQHTFCYIDDRIKTDGCEAVINQIGILPSGEVVACPWAIDEEGKPLDDFFYLGNVPEESLEEILQSEKAELWMEQELNYCKTKKLIESYFSQNFKNE